MNDKKEFDYIEWSEDMTFLKERIDHKLVGIQKGHWSQGITAISYVLFNMYGETSMNSLYQRNEYPNEVEIFSKFLTKYFDFKKSSSSTRSIILYSIKKILNHTGISKTFITKLTLLKEKKYIDPILNFVPGRIKNLNDVHKGRIIALKWAENIKTILGYSEKTSVVFFNFILSLLIQLNLPIEKWKDECLNTLKSLSFETIKNKVLKVPLILKTKVKINFTQNFFISIIEHPTLTIEDFKYWANKSPKTKPMLEPDNDIHRISVDELEKMYTEASKNIRTELIFMLFVTTGMRVGGLCNIKVEYVSEVINNEIIIKDIGKTIEKGNKWFSFTLTKRVKDLVHFWLKYHRPPKNEYLFPSSIGNKGLSINRINGIIKEIGIKVGVKGKHIHPHSFRHTYAHMLLEVGNKPELVSKLLGHNSVATTEKYYLKESAIEASRRANIPWLENKEKQKIIPTFLELEKKIDKKKNNKKILLKGLLKDIKDIN